MAAGRTVDEGWQLHTKWVTALWSGRAAEVLADWQSLAEFFTTRPDCRYRRRQTLKREVSQAQLATSS